MQKKIKICLSFSSLVTMTLKKKTLKIYKYEKTSFLFIQKKVQTKIYLGMTKFINPKANPPIG